MYFRMALALGWPSVEWGLRNISSRELSEWEAFFELEGPPGDVRTEMYLAMVASVIANVNRDAKSRPLGVEDFLLFREAAAPGRDEDAEALQRAQLEVYVMMLRKTLGPSAAGTVKPATNYTD